VSVTHPVVFLDRDGVLNRLISRDGGNFSPRTAAEFKLFPWSSESTRLLAHLGFRVVVVTNQPDISRGLMDATELNAMHDVLRQECHVDAIYTCTHDNLDNCSCRKPLPGLLLKAAAELSLRMRESWMIGDRESDIRAGISAGVQTILIESGQDQVNETEALHRCENLYVAARWLENQL
jgi:D-glycero-D-manno-heptose 1,7-bisphosphate phosphatase